MSPAKCPYCKLALSKKPKRKKQCPHCGNYIFVRKGRLLTEDQKTTEEWKDRLAHFGVTAQTFARQRQHLTSRFNSPPAINDVIWGILNDLGANSRDRQDLSILYYEMAHLVFSEGRNPKPYLAEAVKQALLEMQAGGVRYVKVCTVNDDCVCPACQKLQDAVFPIEQAIADMPIPNVCEDEAGLCRCSYVAHLEEVGTVADNRLSQAILEIESGNKAKARELIASVLRQSPKNADAWWWMAIALDDPDKKRQCWERVLGLRPGDEQAIKALIEAEMARQTPVTSSPTPKRIVKKQTKSGRRGDNAYWTRLLLIGGIPIVLLGLCVVLVFAGALFKPNEKAAATLTPLPEARSLEPRTMYFCNYDRCRDSQWYGKQYPDPSPLDVWNKPSVEVGSFVRTPEHGEAVVVVGEWREREGPFGLWLELDNGHWTIEWQLTDEVCDPDNIDKYSYTNCAENKY